MKKIFCLMIIVGLFTVLASAQHEHHIPQKDTSMPKAHDTVVVNGQLIENFRF